MRVLVLNSSGNMGKSSISREVFFTNLENCKVIEVESYNTGSTDFKSMNKNIIKIRPEEIEDFYNILVANKNCVMDLGASKIESFFDTVNEIGFEMLDIIDYFIVPVVGDSKMSKDTVKTIQLLLSVGIDEEKIKLLFNKFDRKAGTGIKEQYNDFLYHLKERKLKFNVESRIKDELILDQLPVINDMHKHDLLTSDILNGTNWEAEMMKAANEGKSEEEITSLSFKYLTSLKAKRLKLMTSDIIKKLQKA